MACFDCVYCKFPRTADDNGGACKCKIMNYKTIDVYVIGGETPEWCPKSYGTPKERGADKPKITCLNCKHLMFSDMYGECNKQLRIVNPSDTCEYAESKERGGGK